MEQHPDEPDGVFDHRRRLVHAAVGRGTPVSPKWAKWLKTGDPSYMPREVREEFDHEQEE